MSSTGFDGRPGGPERGVGYPDPGGDPGLPLLPRLGEAAGFTMARVFVVVAAAIGADRVVGLSQTSGWAVLAAVTVWSASLVAQWWTAMAGAGVAWLLGTGFLSNRLGELSFRTPDREHLAVMAFAGAAAVLVSRRAAAATRTRNGRGT